MEIRESEEMYLETILLLRARKGVVRSIDIAEELNYSRASVSRAMGLLQQRDFIVMDQSGAIKLTESGSERAEKIYERHQILTKLLMMSGAPNELAEENACRIEHVISDEMFDYLKKFFEKC